MSVTNKLDIEIKAESKKATPSLDAMIAKLKEVDSALDSLNPQKLREISDAVKSMKGAKINLSSGGNGANSVKALNNQYAKTNSLLNTLTATANKANKGFLGLNGTMFKLAATWGMFYASAYPFIKLLNKAWTSTQSAMDYVETYNYYKVTMDKIFKQVAEDEADTFQTNYIKSLNDISEKMTGFKVGINGELFENFSKNLGADPNALMNYQARIGAVTNAVGLLTDESVNAQKALSMLSQDLSSLTNTDLQSVMTNLQSGLIGQSRALYKYGIDITQATLKTYALKYGVTQAVSSMTQAQKMELRLLAILDQSKVAWGDMANTVGSVANQYRIFGQSVSNLSRVLGNLFLPIVSKVLPYVNALLISLRQVFSMLGFKLYGNNWLKDSLDGISGGYSGVEDIADAFDDVENSANGAGKAAKKLKTALMGFDELNIINDQSGGSGSGSGGGGGWDLSDAIADALGDYESVWNKAFADAENKAAELANKITSYFKSGDFKGLGKWISTSLRDELNSIDWESIYQGARTFGTGLAEFLNGLIRPDTFYAVGRTIANSLNTAIYTALSFGETFDFVNLGKSISAYWNGIFENFDFASFGKMVGIWVGGITKTIATAIKNIKWDELFNGIKDAINGFFKGLADSGVTIGDIAIVIGAITVKKILKFAWGTAALKLAASTLSSGIVKLLGTYFGVAFAADTGVGTALATGISSQLAKVGPMIQNMKAFKLGDAVFGDFSTLGAAMTTTFGKLATSFIGFGSVIGGVSLVVHEFFDMFQNGIDGMSIALATIGTALAAFGVAVTGPIGLAVAGVTGLITVIYELVKADNELRAIQDQKVFDNIIQGTSEGTHTLQDFVNKMNETVEVVGKGVEEANVKFGQLETARTEISKTVGEIETIAFTMGVNRTLTETEIEKLGTAFDQLKNQLKEAISASYDYIIAETMADYQYLEATGQITEETKKKYQERIAALAGSKQAALDNASELADAYYTEYQAYQEVLEGYNNGTKTEEELAAASDRLFEAWSNLSGFTEPFSDDFSKVDQAISDASESMQDFSGSLDLSNANLSSWEDVQTEINGTISSITAAYNEGVEAIDADTTEFEETLDRLVAAGQLSRDEADKQLEEHNAVVQNKLEQLRGTYNTELSNIETDVLNMIPLIVQAASDEWATGTVTGFTSEGEYIQSQVNEFYKGLVTGENGVSQALDTAFAETDFVQDQTLEEIAQDINGRMFSYIASEVAMSPDILVLSDNWQNVISDAVSQIDLSGAAETVSQQGYAAMYDAGQNVAQGAADGVSSAADVFNNQMEVMAQGGMTTFDYIMAIHSPSQEMYTRGEYIVQGLNNGIADYSSKTTPDIMKNWGVLITSSFDDCFKEAFTNVTDVWDELVPYFEKDVFDNLNSALDEELEYISESVTTNYESFIELTTTTYEQYSTMTTELTTALVTTFDETTTSISDMFETMWGAIKDSSVVNANSIVGVFEGLIGNLADGVNNFLSSVEAQLRAVAEETGSSFSGFGRVSKISIPRISINAYRTGGFPEDGLFFANHNELVGQFSNGQTAVANNEQIVEGIRYGVASAVREELGLYLRDIADNTGATASNTEDIKNKPSQTIGDRNVARAAIRGSRSMGLTIRTT